MKTPNGSPYRSEIDALRDRKESLEHELARLKEQTSELESLRARELELAHELASVSGRLAARATKRVLPMLDQVRVASPCSASWDEMLPSRPGDERVRFCVSCEKNVYNLSAMSRADAEQLLHERAQGELCVRYYQRAEGTIMTSDCPVGVKRRRRKALAITIAGVGAMAFAAATTMLRATCRQGAVGRQEVLGERAPIATATTTPPTTPGPRSAAMMGQRAR